MKKFSITLYGLAACLLMAIGFGIYANGIDSKQSQLERQSEAKALAEAQLESSPFEQAVAIIKKYEGLHQPCHWPLVGYGHQILPGEKFPRGKALSEQQADNLLRKDLLKNCALFRDFGPDSLLLGVLAYNIGCGNVKRSRVTVALREGNRDIRDIYLSHCRFRGKALSQLKRRRIEEFDILFVNKDSTYAKQHSAESKVSYNNKAMSGQIDNLHLGTVLNFF